MFIQVKKNQIYYEIHGQGQPVVFFHGFGGNHVIWSEQVNALQREGFQAITFDQPGHGSTYGPYASQIKDLIDDSAELIRNLNLKHPILIGHSMGASVVWGLIKFHPELKVKSIVTIDQSPKMLNDHNWPYGFLNLNETNFKEILIENKHVKETLNGLDDRVWRKLAPYKKSNPFNRTNNLPLIFDHVQKDWLNVTKAINIPYLNVVSTNSPYFDSGYANILESTNKNIILKKVNDTGHDIMAEQPDEFNKIMFDFLLNN